MGDRSLHGVPHTGVVDIDRGVPLVVGLMSTAMSEALSGARHTARLRPHLCAPPLMNTTLLCRSPIEFLSMEPPGCKAALQAEGGSNECQRGLNECIAPHTELHCAPLLNIES